MTYATHLLNHSRKLRNASGILRNDSTILVRCFSKDTLPSTGRRDEIQKTQWRGCLSGKKDGNLSIGVIPSTVNRFNYSCRAQHPDFFMVSLFGGPRGKFSRISTRKIIPVAGSVFKQGSPCSQTYSIRGYAADSGLPAHQEIGMPSLSPTMTEGNIARWLKKEGDKLSPGEVLCEVETDKATVEMECMEEGYLAKIIRGDGSKDIKVGEVIAITVEEEDDIGKFKEYKPSTSSSAVSDSPPPKKEAVEEPVRQAEQKIPKPTEAPSAKDRIFASPLAKSLAEEHNVPLSDIRGTGPDGSIVKADIEDYLASSKKGVPASVSKAKDTTIAGLDYSDIPHSQIRKITASRLLQSKQTIPHYYLSVDTCVDKLVDLRSRLNHLQEASGGKRISINDLVIKAAAMALRKVPQCNSSWTDDYIRQYHNVNINVAVQTDNGLFVPVIRDADKKGLSTISDEVKQLAQKAKDNSLKPDDYEGGTFTVSNLGGPFGIKQFCAIINPPQSGILAVGSAEKRVVPGAGPDQFDFASFMTVTLSCDHRVIDGAIGAEWLKAFKGYIENPESMLL